MDLIRQNLATKNIMGITPPPDKFSLTDWHLSYREKQRCTEDQHQLADRILCESERLIDESKEESLKNRREVDHQLGVKVKDIEFVKGEIERQKKSMDLEIETLSTYRQRVEATQKAVEGTAMSIIQKCLILRDGRTGIDLCMDRPELEMKKEIEMIMSTKVLLIRVMEQIKEQLRRIRRTNYTLTRDIEDKENVLVIDKFNVKLNENSPNLYIYHGKSPMDPAILTQDDWEAATQKNIDDAQMELVAGRPLRASIDVILTQVIDDLNKQYEVTNEAFRERIELYKDVKAKLENQHFETVRQANEMMQNIEKLQKALEDKGRFLALSHTRLGHRCQRSSFELCRDEAETYLINDVKDAKEMTKRIQQMLAESQASLRYLLRTQVLLEEDINVKTNSIKIDEVECMGLRAKIDYRVY